MKGKFNVITNEKDPMILVITPLRRKNKILKSCEYSIIQGQKDIKKIWISFQSKNNSNINRISGYKKSKNLLRKKLPNFLLFCDNDIEWRPGIFSEMIDILKNTDDNIGYCYCRFRYETSFGNMDFDEDDPIEIFDKNKILLRNWISTMSIQKTNIFKKYGKFDLSLERFQDWDLWLNYWINHGIRGIPLKKRGFTTILSDGQISTKSDRKGEGNIKYKIIEDKYNLEEKRKYFKLPTRKSLENINST